VGILGSHVSLSLLLYVPDAGIGGGISLRCLLIRERLLWTIWKVGSMREFRTIGLVCELSEDVW
jgi:hypothetical protein